MDFKHYVQSLYMCEVHKQLYMFVNVGALLRLIRENSTIFDVILTSSYDTLYSPHSGGSIAKIISLDDDEEPTHKVFTKSQWSM